MNVGKYNSTDFTSTINVFESFVDQISEVIKAPVILEDAQHRLLGYSNHKNVTDSVRIETIMGKQVPEKVINCLWEQGILPSLLASDKPIRIRKLEGVDLENRILVAIRNKEDVLGYIWVMEGGGHLNDEEMDYLSRAADAIKGSIIRYYSCRNQQQGNSQDFFWQLLLGNIKSDNEIRKKLQQMNIPPPKLFSVIVFRLSEEVDVGLRKQIGYLLNTTQQTQVIFHIFNRQDLVVLVASQSRDSSGLAYDGFIKSFINLTQERLGILIEVGVYGGIYKRFIKIEDSYKEALQVLDIKERLPKEIQSILGYDDLGIYKFINILLADRRREDYENPILKRLKEYDSVYNQQLVETLEVYLDNDCNTNETANSLYIHTNTLNYRLRRIREISGLDLGDFNQKIGIYIDLKIDRLFQQHTLIK